MASEFKEGQHIFFLMMDGKTQLDSQNKPRYYLTRERAQQYARSGCEIVEYAPIYDIKPSCAMITGVAENGGVKRSSSKSQDLLISDKYSSMKDDLHGKRDEHLK